MINLQLNHRGEFQYRTAARGDIVEVSLSYSKGGPNYFSGTTNRRGVYVHVTPKTINEDGTMSFMMFHGFKVLVKEFGKKPTAKRMAEIAEKLDVIVFDVAKLYDDKDHTLASNVLLEAIRQAYPVETPLAIAG